TPPISRMIPKIRNHFSAPPKPPLTAEFVAPPPGPASALAAELGTGPLDAGVDGGAEALDVAAATGLITTCQLLMSCPGAKFRGPAVADWYPFFVPPTTTEPPATGVDPPAVNENRPRLSECVKYEWFAASCRLTIASATGWPVVMSSTTPEILDAAGAAGPRSVTLKPWFALPTLTDDRPKVA